MHAAQLRDHSKHEWSNLLRLEVVLSAPSSILLVCHANVRHLDMPVIGVVLQAICKGKAQGFYSGVEMR